MPVPQICQEDGRKPACRTQPAPGKLQKRVDARTRGAVESRSKRAVEEDEVHGEFRNWKLETKIDLRNFSNGIYFVTTDDGKQKAVKKFLKE